MKAGLSVAAILLLIADSDAAVAAEVVGEWGDWKCGMSRRQAETAATGSAYDEYGTLVQVITLDGAKWRNKARFINDQLTETTLKLVDKNPPVQSECVEKRRALIERIRKVYQPHTAKKSQMNRMEERLNITQVLSFRTGISVTLGETYVHDQRERQFYIRAQEVNQGAEPKVP